jgi:hypothetical protein
MKEYDCVWKDLNLFLVVPAFGRFFKSKNIVTGDRK